MARMGIVRCTYNLSCESKLHKEPRCAATESDLKALRKAHFLPTKRDAYVVLHK